VCEHPLIPTSTKTAEALNRMADQLTRAGASVSAESALLPDLAQTALTYTKLFFSFAAAYWPAEVYDRYKMKVTAAPANIDEPSIRRARAAVLSHRDWVLADQIRGSLRKRWHDLFRAFDIVLCPTMPTPAFAHDQLPDHGARRIGRRRGNAVRGSGPMADDCEPVRLAVNGRSDRTIESGASDRDAKHRSVSGR
jgi:amidase